MKKVFPTLFALVFLVSCANSSSSSSSVSSSINSSTSSSSSSTVVETSYDNDYYKEILTSTVGVDLKDDLRALITTTHKYQTTYKEIRYMFKDSDKVESGKMLTFYAHAEIDGTWDSGTTYNREHVWPQSTGWFKESGAGSDLHHIRPSIPGINSSRGNLPFGDFDENDSTKVNSNGHLGGYKKNGMFEPLDHTKGDVARIIFYLVTRYKESDNYKITNVATSYEMLIDWHELDPVDEYERNKNEYVYDIQGNRNPFIDYPEMANKIWDIDY